jgi:hypothetical protein
MVFSDIRLKNALVDILRPSPKEGMNPRSLKFLKLIVADKSNSVLFATFPKSGWNWTADILCYCIVKYFTNEYNVKYKAEATLKESEEKPYRLFYPADSRATAGIRIREIFPKLSIDYLLHAHGPWKYSPLWGLDSAKTVFVTRNIPTMLFSYYKSRGKKYASFEECLVDQKVMDRTLEFYNSWGRFCELHKNHMIVRYEDYKTSPVKTFSEMITFVFGITIPVELIQEALSYYSIENQKKREFSYTNEEHKHFHYKGASDYSDQIPEKTLKYIYERINRELVHNFGYEYPKP